MEIWKDIRGYEGLYQVSNVGQIKSLERIRKSGEKRSYVQKEKILKQSKTTTGYYKVELCKNRKRKSLKVHRLVAAAFIPNPKKKPNVNHIDGNKENNLVENLNWCTQKENMIHATLCIKSRSKLDKIQEIELVKMYLSMNPIKNITDKFGISKTTIHAILSRNKIGKFSIKERKIKYPITPEFVLEKLKTMTQKALAKEIGCDASLISHYVKRIKKSGGIYYGK